MSESFNLVERRERNVAENRAVLEKLNLEIYGSSHPETQVNSNLKKKKRVFRPKLILPPRHFLSRRAKQTAVTSRKLTSRRVRSSVSPDSSSNSSVSSSLSGPKMVVNFGFHRKNVSDGSDDDFTMEDEEDLSDGSGPHRRHVRHIRHSKTPVGDITDLDINMVSDSTSDKFYDKENGTTCHQCRQKTGDQKTICRSDDCFGVRGQFCGPCLRNRYGEDAKSTLRDPEWTCPPCRGICNCSFCLKRRGRTCTGILIHEARHRGYDDVNSYLQSKH